MAEVVNPPRDPNTLSNYNNFVTTSITANLEINFDKKSIGGNVLLKLKSITNAAAKEILLDSSFLRIESVKVGGKTAKWELLPRFEPYGSALKIVIDEGIAIGQMCEIDVRMAETDIISSLTYSLVHMM